MKWVFLIGGLGIVTYLILRPKAVVSAVAPAGNAPGVTGWSTAPPSDYAQGPPPGFSLSTTDQFSLLTRMQAQTPTGKVWGLPRVVSQQKL